MIDVPAIVLTALNQLPSLETVTVHDPGPNEVTVRMVASGVCHTDVSYMTDARVTPMLLGHEGAGIVETVGDNVTHVKVGDHVVINWLVKCGECMRCRSSQPDLCENPQGTAAPRIFYKGQPLAIMTNAGTFCPLVVVPAKGAIPIRHDMPLDKAALLGCAVATGVGAALNTAKVKPYEIVVVIGAGGVGLNVIQGARLANCTRIIVIDVNDEKLELARRFGATETINAKSVDPVKAILDRTNGRGVDQVFEVVGSPDTMRQGIDMLARGGTLTLIGAAQRDALLSFHPRRFMAQQQKIQGAVYGNIYPEVDFPLYADWYMDGRLLLDDLHTETIRLRDVPDVFARQHPVGIRPVVDFTAS